MGIRTLCTSSPRACDTTNCSHVIFKNNSRPIDFNPNQEHVCNTSPFLGDIFPPGCEEYFPSKMEGVYLGARDGADFVGDRREDQHEPDARSAQRRDQRHLPFDEG